VPGRDHNQVGSAEHHARELIRIIRAIDPSMGQNQESGNAIIATIEPLAAIYESSERSSTVKAPIGYAALSRAERQVAIRGARHSRPEGLRLTRRAAISTDLSGFTMTTLDDADRRGKQPRRFAAQHRSPHPGLHCWSDPGLRSTLRGNGRAHVSLLRIMLASFRSTGRRRAPSSSDRGRDL